MAGPPARLGLKQYLLSAAFVTVLVSSIWWDQRNRKIYVEKLKVEVEEAKQRAEELKSRNNPSS